MVKPELIYQRIDKPKNQKPAEIKVTQINDQESIKPNKPSLKHEKFENQKINQRMKIADIIRNKNSDHYFRVNCGQCKGIAFVIDPSSTSPKVFEREIIHTGHGCQIDKLSKEQLSLNEFQIKPESIVTEEYVRSDLSGELVFPKDNEHLPNKVSARFIPQPQEK